MFVTFTFTGTMASGTDNTGVFGSPNANLTGKPFSLTLTVDDTRGAPEDGVNQTGISTGIDPTAVTAALTINAKTYTYPTAGTQNSITRSANNTIALLDFSYSANYQDPASQVSVIISSSADSAPYLATDNWEAPFSTYTLSPLTSAGGDQALSSDFSIDTGGTASGAFTIQTITETTSATSPTPTPTPTPYHRQERDR